MFLGRIQESLRSGRRITGSVDPQGRRGMPRYGLSNIQKQQKSGKFSFPWARSCVCVEAEGEPREVPDAFSRTAEKQPKNILGTLGSNLDTVSE